MQTSDTPRLTTFNPNAIPYQRRVIDLIRHKHDYSTANLEILLSGAYGSAKSTLLAHIGVTHALRYPGARVVVGRRSMPDLKRTIWREILDHIAGDLEEGKHYEYNRSSMTIRFTNGSEITAASWADKRYAKFRSLKISCLLLEELTENDDEDMEAFKQLRARVRRVPGIRENVIVAATNPDSPSHWVYKYWIDEEARAKHPNRHVFYSKTEDNIFLDKTYVQSMRADMSPKEYQRYGLGHWLDLIGETIYSEYDTERQYLKDHEYKIDPSLPIGITWDFNIGENKPMSCALFQLRGDTFHFFAEVVLHSSRTADVLDELLAREILDPKYRFGLYGDAAGKNRDTRSSRSDYEIIRKFFDNANISYVYQVPPANPPVRTRHNAVNSYCKNELGECRLYFYKGCATMDEGMRLTKLKTGGNYVEDDSKPYQHITTAIGYAITFIHQQARRATSGTRYR